MEQLSIRDWMILIGGMMIAAVLIDAVRRYWRERRAELKLNARIERAAPLSSDDDAFNLLTELPNGGARIVQRDDLQIETAMAALDPVPSFNAAGESTANSVAENQSAPEPAFRADPIDVAVEAELASSVGEEEDPEQMLSPGGRPETPDVGEESASVLEGADQGAPAMQPASESEPSEREESKTEESISRRRTVKPPAESDAKDAESDAADPGTVDWLDTLEPDEELDPELPEHGRLPRGANTHVFILYVVAQAEEGFSGTEILEALLACDLRFGDMDFFHRHERASGRGPIEFSVANMMKPGVFDIDNMEPLQTRGLMFFVTLPGPSDMLKAFDYMYETVKVVAKQLRGDIQDETRSVITRQSLEHMRQQIRELERRLLVRRN
jgi:cell division protein ZipA